MLQNRAHSRAKPPSVSLLTTGVEAAREILINGATANPPRALRRTHTVDGIAGPCACPAAASGAMSQKSGHQRD